MDNRVNYRTSGHDIIVWNNSPLISLWIQASGDLDSVWFQNTQSIVTIQGRVPSFHSTIENYMNAITSPNYYYSSTVAGQSIMYGEGSSIAEDASSQNQIISEIYAYASRRPASHFNDYYSIDSSVPRCPGYAGLSPSSTNHQTQYGHRWPGIARKSSVFIR